MEIPWRFEDENEKGWVCPLTEQEQKEVRAFVNGEDGCCAKESPYGWLCTRGGIHTGPHIATGLVNVYAIWD